MPRLSTESKITVVVIPGNVILSKRCKRDAPSIAAASYKEGLIPVKAAKKIIVLNPNSFQTSLPTMMKGNKSALAKNNVGLIPNTDKIPLTGPL
ncbi:hypothetical protein D3C71_1872040 [compost metagenome]